MRIIGILTTVMSLLCFAAVCLVVTAVLAFGFRMPF
jgi:hypothetical protein